MKNQDIDFSVEFLKLLDLIEKSRSGIRPVSESGDDSVYFGLYFDQNVGMFEPDVENVCYYPIVDMVLSEQSDEGWVYYNRDRKAGAWYRVCHDYRDGKNLWYIRAQIAGFPFYVFEGVVLNELKDLLFD